MDAPRQVLVAGGGPAAIEASLALQRLAEERVRITLVSDTESFTYRPSATVQPFGFPPPQRFSLPGLRAPPPPGPPRGPRFRLQRRAGAPRRRPPPRDRRGRGAARLRRARA